jgi:hypothetical protein
MRERERERGCEGERGRGTGGGTEKKGKLGGGKVGPASVFQTLTYCCIRLSNTHIYTLHAALECLLLAHASRGTTSLSLMQTALPSTHSR